MRDKMEDIKWFIQDHIKEIGAGIVVIVAIAIGVLFTSGGSEKKGDVKENSKAELTQMEEQAETLRGIFSELQTSQQGIHKENVVLKVALYLKQPFLSEDELRTHLDDYMKLLKQKYSVDKKYVTGLEVSIYDRKIVFDKELQPRATAYYMLKKNKEEEATEDEQTEPKKDAFGNEIKRTKTNVARKVDMSREVWDETIAQSGEPKYENYEWVVTGFEPMNKETPTTPLSDEEFAFYLKLNQYSALMGSLTGGAQLYLQWDLGQNVFKDGVGAILKEFKTFSDRQTKLNGLADYYDNVDVLKKKLAVERPQFLLFAETKEVVDDKEEAQAKLIKFNPNLYTDAIKENIDKVAEELKDGKAPIKGDKGKENKGKNSEEIQIDFGKTGNE
ncbi:hypothetical protein B4086_5488 [Bacillus cereus]|nr:hypothetical protein B4086_5488 [Bacillus cereus]